MKKMTLSLLLSGGLALAPLASPAADATDTDRPDPIPPQAAEQQIRGMGVGALIGTLLGGPVGAVAGATFGNLAGWGNGMEEAWREEQQQRVDTQARLSLSDLQRQRSQQQLSRQQRESRALKQELQQARTTPKLAPLLKTLTIDIHFQTSSAVVEPHYYPRLRQMATELARLPELQLQLTGFADPRGSSAYNRQLASDRVSALSSLLVQQGVSTDRIRQKINGEERALSTSDTGLLPFDRRVEIRFQLNITNNNPGSLS